MSMPDDLPLGRKTDYPRHYDPGLLRSIPRAESRRETGIPEPLPFDGVDIWNAYELSWLDATGKPCAHVGELRFPATSPHMVESKSLKLYLFSLNQERYASTEEVRKRIREDLTSAVDADVRVELTPVAEISERRVRVLPGTCIDDAQVVKVAENIDPDLLSGSIDTNQETEETLHSHLFQTHCPVTNQPDWASVLIRYQGPRIDHKNLLSYLVSYRHDRGFAEACVEQMFMDILRQCQPTKLTIYARFSRRGGLDINPFRSNFESHVENLRLWRQ
jgi:7-cyano-7-deazaguanine reductase